MSVVLVLGLITLPLLGGSAAVIAGNSDWTEASISGISILDMEALDANTVWAVGYGLTQGFILKTTDGGANWVKQKTASAVWPTQAFSSVSVVDANTAWASGDRTLYRTTDGGANWNAVYTSTQLIQGIPDVCAVNADNAWAITTDALLNSSIMMTTDGGATWVSLHTRSYLEGVLSRISAVDAWNVWAAGGALTNGTTSVSGCVIKTNSMGLSWEDVTPADAPPLMNVVALDNYDVWVSGRGAIMHTTDAGATWATPYTSSGTDFFGLSVTDGTTIWAAGKTPALPTGGCVVKTVDGGSTWKSVYSSTLLRHFFCMASVDAAKVWAGGGNSLSTSAVILRTVKGGDTLPDITAISPASGVAGDTVTISGSDFGSTRGTSKVLFGGAEAASYVSWSSGSIKVTVPAGLGGYVKVTVVTSAGASNPAEFLVAIPVSVDSIDPAFGMQFTFSMQVKLTGSGFLKGMTVRMVKGDLVIEGYDVNVISGSELTCNIGLFGAEPGVYDVVVTSPSGSTDTLTGGFSVTSACGAGAGTVGVALGGMLGLVSLGHGIKRRRRRRH